MTRLLAAASSIALAAFAACSAYDEEASPIEAPGRDAASAEAAPDAAGASDAQLAQNMVVVETTTSRFAIDAREVTVAEWTVFRDTHAFVAAAMPPVCAYKTTFGPNTGGACLVDEIATLPIHCVDWCDAFAYCAATGKRLCGRIGGGAASTAQSVDPSASQWTRGCANGTNADRFPHGTLPKPGACNTRAHDAGRVLPVGSLSDCEGGVTGLFDMSGNVSEWTDACDALKPGGPNDLCATRGGSYVSSEEPRCGEQTLRERRFEGRTIGFRCCADL